MSKDELRRRLQEAISKSPSRGKIRRVALFGSQVRGEAKKNSDIDLLIEVDRPMGALEFVSIELFLSKELGTRVDLVEPDALSRYFRDDVLQEAEVLYKA
ncbi:MAG: nucleotidyltransferase family protein [Patescibacteria group bacterium]